MSKIFSILFILNLMVLPFWLFTTPVYATECSAAGVIGPNPNTFLVVEKVKLNFTIGDTQLANLKAAGINFIKVSIKNQLSFSDDHIVPIASKFSVEITDKALTSVKAPGAYNTGNLYMSPDKNNDFIGPIAGPDNHFRPLCGEIKYTVTDKKCSITSAPSAMPPGSKADFKFTGLPKTGYPIYYNDKSAARGFSLFLDSSGVALSATTDESGNGVFNNIPVPGVHGDRTTILISGGGSLCSTQVEINQTLSKPQITDQPTSIVTTTIKCNPKDPLKKCTSSGDKDKVLCGDDKNNPGIRTAIGCIHTSPVGFVKDALKFILAISGGLAFLLMLLGAFQMLTSAGNPETLQAGRERFSSAIIGLLLVIFAVLLLRIIGVDILGLGEQFGFK